MKAMLQRWFGSASPAVVEETTETLAQRGVAEAQFSLGLRYASGKGDALDYAQAKHWYLKAASQNHPLAYFNLGMMHAHGQGMLPDLAESLVCIQKAADLGDASAQYHLGLSHHRAVGDGTGTNSSQSRIDAYKWFSLAAEQGYQGAVAAGNVVGLYMTQDEMREASRRITAFNSGEVQTQSFPKN